MIRIATLLVVLAGPIAAETLIAARTIPARSIIGPEDVLVREIDVLGALETPARAIGQEARVALYAGRPIRAADVGVPAVVERNQIITLIYRHGGILISTEGRALDRAGPGDLIRVMNISSRTTVSAQVDATGTAFVTQ
jgi:flagella basal body P-ring formation protein FlgA